MASLITQGDGSVRWDYDLPEEKPKKTAAKRAEAKPEPEES